MPFKPRDRGRSNATMLGVSTSQLRGILFLLLFGAGLISHVLASAARDPRAVAARLEPEVVKTVALDAIVYELQRDRLIRSLKGGLFEMTPDDTRGVFERAYSAEEMTRKLRRVHGELIRYVDRFPPRDSIYFVVSFAEEKPVLLDSLMVFWRRRIASLPDCDPLEVTRIGFGALLKVAGLKSDEGFAKDLPRCRPPRSIETKLLDGLQTAIDESKRSGKTSVSAFPKHHRPSYAGFRRSMLGVRIFALTGSFVFLAMLIGAAGLYVLARREGRAERARLLSFGLLFLALVLAALGAWASLRGRELDLWPVFFHRPREALSDSTRYWFTLVIYVVRGAIGVAGSRAFIFAACCLAAAGLLFARTRRSSTTSLRMR